MSKQYAIVTGAGETDEWLWTSATMAAHRTVGRTWESPMEGGADLFDCLTRNSKIWDRHRIKRIVEVKEGR